MIVVHYTLGELAHFNDDVLFGENWNNHDIDVKTRSNITEDWIAFVTLLPDTFCTF